MQRTVPHSDQVGVARFNQLTVERFQNNIVKAVQHSNSRNSHIVQAACYFSLMRSHCTDLANAAVSIEAAERQMFKSNNGYQSAHYLPGQIKLSNRLPWMFLNDRGTRERLECLFADVEHLPSSYNKADSAAEEKGLREAFRTMTEEIMRHGLLSRKSGLQRDLVRRLYAEVWVPRAITAFSDAISQKILVNPVPKLEIDEYGNIDPKNLQERGEADWSRDDEIAILTRYREAMRDTPHDLSDPKMTAIEREFRP
jgi:hypothetical protein